MADIEKLIAEYRLSSDGLKKDVAAIGGELKKVETQAKTSGEASGKALSKGIGVAVADVRASVKQAGQEIKVAFTNTALDTATDKLEKYGNEVAETTGQFKTLNAELKSLEKTINSGALAGKDLEVAKKRAGELKDRITDTKEEIRRLASDTRGIDAVVEGARGIAAAMSVAQGAAALFGGENEKLQQAILKTQGALALLNGVQELGTIITAKGGIATKAYSTALAVAEGIQKSFAVSSTVAWAAISGGIGVVITGIAAFISSLSGVDKAVDDFAETQQERNARIERERQESFGSFIEGDRKFNDELDKERKRRLVNGQKADEIEFDQAGRRIEFAQNQIRALREGLYDALDLTLQQELGLIKHYEEIINENTYQRYESIREADEKRTAEAKKQAEARARVAKEEEDYLWKITQENNKFIDEQEKESGDKLVEEKKAIEARILKNAQDSAEAQLEATIELVDAQIEKEKERQRVKSELQSAEFQAAQSALQALSEITNNMFAEDQARLDQQRETELQKAGDNAKQKEAIEKKFAVKKAQLARQQAIAEKTTAIFSIGISTAQGIMETIKKYGMPEAAPFIALIASTAALQTAAVLSKPLPEIPKYEQGGAVPLAGGQISPSGHIIGRSHRNRGVLIEAEGGEYITKKESAHRYAKELEAANEMRLESYIHRNYVLPALQEQGRAGSVSVMEYDDDRLRRTVRKSNEQAARYIVQGVVGGIANQSYLNSRYA